MLSRKRNNQVDRSTNTKAYRVKNLKLIVLLLVSLLAVGCASKTTTLDHSHGQPATATIELPRYITALYINSEEVTLPFMVGYPYFLNVAEGPVALKFIYAQNWGRNDRTRARVKSNIMTLNFQADAGNNYTIDFDKPSSTADPGNGEYYIRNFQAWVSTDDKKITSANNTGESPKGITVLLKQESQIPSGARLTELKSLWKAANTEERKSFMNWVIAPTQ